MKKSVLPVFIGLLIFATTLFSSCGSSKWMSDFDKAKAIAKKTNKDIYLLFSGDDWAESSLSFKQKVTNTKEFAKKYGKEFVFVNIDFSQDEYAKVEVADDASPSEKKQAEQIRLAYEKKEALGRCYNVQQFPSSYVISFEGYVLSPIEITSESLESFEHYSSVLESKRENILQIKKLVEDVRNSEGVQKAKAIDSLLMETSPEYRILLKELVFEFPSLDKNNETGFLGDYEIQGAYYKSVEAIANGENPTEPLVLLCDNENLNVGQKQQALYMAAFIESKLYNPDINKVHEYLLRAYEMDSESEYAQEIFMSLQSVKSLLQNSMENAN